MIDPTANSGTPLRSCGKSWQFTCIGRPPMAKRQLPNDFKTFSNPPRALRRGKAEMTPGAALRIHRESRGRFKTKQGELLGGVTRQPISAPEKGRRPVSLNMSRRVSELFGIPLSSILESNRIPEQDSGGHLYPLHLINNQLGRKAKTAPTPKPPSTLKERSGLRITLAGFLLSE